MRFLDAIWVTIPPRRAKDGYDQAVYFESMSDVSGKFDEAGETLTLDVLGVMLEQARRFEDRIHARASATRRKASILVGASSFVLSVTLVAATRFGEILPSIGLPIRTIGLVIFVLMVSHLVRSVWVALGVLVREVSVHESPHEFLSVPSESGTPVVSVMRATVSRLVVYANQTDREVNRRVNRLLLAQTAFGYGLGYVLVYFVYTIALSVLP